MRDLDGIRFWIFDLDNTLYPPECEFLALVDARMTEWVSCELGLAQDEARDLQKRMLHLHGTTLAGMMREYGIDPDRFLDEVHDVSHDRLVPDPALRAAIARLPGKKLVFTNGSARHAYAVLDSLALRDVFDDVFHLQSADLTPKPQQAAYDAFVRLHGVDAAASAFFEDSARNLEPAAAMGMTTVLVGPFADAFHPPFVHHRTERLEPFLSALAFKEAA